MNNPQYIVQYRAIFPVKFMERACKTFVLVEANEATRFPSYQAAETTAREHGMLPENIKVEPAPSARRCPECRKVMDRQEDRDADGELTQQPWYECEACDHKEPAI